MNESTSITTSVSIKQKIEKALYCQFSSESKYCPPQLSFWLVYVQGQAVSVIMCLIKSYFPKAIVLQPQVRLKEQTGNSERELAEVVLHSPL